MKRPKRERTENARRGGVFSVKKQAIVERILDLSSRALSEKDRERFISCLKERSSLLAQVAGKGIEAEEAVLKAWLEKEQEVLTRLQEERKRVLQEMDSLSRRRAAVRQYSPKFPFPPMPAFFDKLG
ncbi:MAG: hypothetical protein ABSH25_02015 [Syntrophorhabdales bacterium]|jgi:hypothetical protein